MDRSMLSTTNTVQRSHPPILGLSLVRNKTYERFAIFAATAVCIFGSCLFFCMIILGHRLHGTA